MDRNPVPPFLRRHRCRRKAGTRSCHAFRANAGSFRRLDDEGECQYPHPPADRGFSEQQRATADCALVAWQAHPGRGIVSGRRGPHFHHARHVGRKSLDRGLPRICPPTHERRAHSAGGPLVRRRICRVLLEHRGRQQRGPGRQDSRVRIPGVAAGRHNEDCRSIQSSAKFFHLQRERRP